ncbi:MULTISPECIES: DUF922 domain-containing protein [Mesorhizobium]|uniref:DUF922 domain-containing protein n=1 Tax=Mesorhizobium denitrificans TaxID=2294114 RepID=A0A371XHN7_9HYPH|nr:MULTISPECIES: DUF922 domain-containing protein [Mesorhizobium]RFC68731.1 DUF922 domain-containing protein [Mesorhizobium denitrificans]
MTFRLGAGLLTICLIATVANADETIIGKVIEKTYAVKGGTAYDLYVSIGENGPRGAIANTDYSLTWKRLFDEEGGDCRLVSAKPIFTTTYLLPKATGNLKPPLDRLWQDFITGVREHEHQHGQMLQEMVKTTQERIANARVENDKTCAKVKRVVSDIIEQERQTYRSRSRDFHRAELAEGGNLHQLILTFVNGDRPPPPATTGTPFP